MGNSYSERREGSSYSFRDPFHVRDASPRLRWATLLGPRFGWHSGSFYKRTWIAVGSEKFSEELNLVSFGSWRAAVGFCPSVQRAYTTSLVLQRMVAVET